MSGATLPVRSSHVHNVHASLHVPLHIPCACMQAEYVREGIDWRHIAFEDNQDVLDLIEAASHAVILIGGGVLTFCGVAWVLWP